MNTTTTERKTCNENSKSWTCYDEEIFGDHIPFSALPQFHTWGFYINLLSQCYKVFAIILLFSLLCHWWLCSSNHQWCHNKINFYSEQFWDYCLYFRFFEKKGREFSTIHMSSSWVSSIVTFVCDEAPLTFYIYFYLLQFLLYGILNICLCLYNHRAYTNPAENVDIYVCSCVYHIA